MVKRLAILLALCLAAAVAAPTAAQAPSAPPTPLTMERAILRAFDKTEYERAATLILDYLEQWPNDPAMEYNLACAYSRLGDLEKSTSALYRAVKSGFREFDHMQTDPDLDAIRKEPMYEAILEAARRTADEAAEDALAAWKRTFGEGSYRYEIDEKRRLAFATALDEVSHREMCDMLRREADQLIDTLFGAAPSYYVLIAVPTPEHAEALFGGDDGIGGRYEHARRRLISRDIGGSLRHEFVHAFHYGHMERLGLRNPHPLWIQEGLASLYEDYEVDESGEFRFLPNERNNIVIRRAKSGRIAKWKDLFEMSSDRFMAKAGRTYPLVRSIFEFLASEGKLDDWYKAYVDVANDDPNGTTAFAAAFDKPLEDVERDWLAWIRAQPIVDHRIAFGDAALGITADQNSSNDGVKIAEVLTGSSASRARLRVGDVIVSVDGQETRSLRELQKVIGAKQVGDRVEVRARREGRYFKTTVTLHPLRSRRG